MIGKHSYWRTCLSVSHNLSAFCDAMCTHYNKYDGKANHVLLFFLSFVFDTSSFTSKHPCPTLLKTGSITSGWWGHVGSRNVVYSSCLMCLATLSTRRRENTRDPEGAHPNPDCWGSITTEADRSRAPRTNQRAVSKAHAAMETKRACCR